MYHCVLPTETFSRLYVQPTTGEPEGRYLRRYYAVVPIASIPHDWDQWLDVNARDSSDKGRVPGAIRATLSDKPEWFAAYNRGITVVASRVEYDNKTKELSLRFVDKEYHGVLDGGHTLRAILDSRDSSNGKPQEGYCNLEVFTGLDEADIPSIVEARNTSKQVASKSLMNLEGAFYDLRASLGRREGRISWKENEQGEFDVREVVAILTALDPDGAQTGTQPVVAYSGKEACLKRFKTHYDSFQKLFGVAGDALDMWDAIQYYLPDQYNQRGPEPGSGTGGKFGLLTGVQVLKHPKHLPFIGEQTKYGTPSGYIYPVLSAFRAMLVEKDGMWQWGKGINPIDLIRDGVAADIFIRSVRESINNYRNPNRTGKDAQAWTSAYQAARIIYLEMETP